MPKKWCPFLSTSGCFHLLTFVCSLRPVLASSTAWTNTSWGNISPLAGTGNCFLERKLTSLLTILSATSSALTLLNASLLLPSFPHHLVPAASVATNGSFYPSPPLPNLLPTHQARQEAPGPFLKGQEGLSGVQLLLPGAVTGLSWPVGYLGTQAHHALP